MQYTYFPKTNLNVSRLCLGTMMFGGQTEEKDAIRIMDEALDLGVNFFDTANVYNGGVTEEALEAIRGLFRRESLLVEKKGKNGITDQDLIPMIRRLAVTKADEKTLVLQALVCCQNPTLNPMQLIAAIERYLPEEKPDFAKCCRNEIYDTEEKLFR